MSLLVVSSVGFDTVETPFGKADEVLGGVTVYFSNRVQILDSKEIEERFREFKRLTFFEDIE